MQIFVRLLLTAFIAIQCLSANSAINPSSAVDKVWKMDQKSSQLLERSAKWFQQYEESKTISADLDKELQRMGRSLYQIAVEARRVKRSFEEEKSNRQKQAFELLYEEKEVNPEQETVEAMVIALADLIVYEQIAFFYNASKEDTTLITKLNEIPIYGLRDHFKRLTDSWMSTSNRKEFADRVNLVNKNAALLENLQNRGGLYVKALKERLDTTLTEELVRSASPWSAIKTFFKKDWQRTRENGVKRINWLVYHLSKVFGNAVGAVNWQKYIDCVAVEDLESVQLNVLQPGDVIMEKTEGAITDTFIPGHFGHVAVHIGTPEQLKGFVTSKGVKLLEHPLVVKYLDDLAAGKTTAESVRPGVQLEDIRHWHITDIAVVRAVNYPKELIADAIVKSLSYIGTPYDFNFDVNTSELVVCSELPYQSFKGIHFRTAKSAGRWTISPDDVAVLAGKRDSHMENRPFELIYFNHKTKVVPEEEMYDLYVELLSEESHYDEIPENAMAY